MKTETEIERKYIIRKPDAEALRAMPGYTESTILQTYLAAPSGVTHRVRSRKDGEKTTFTETVKVRIDRMSCRETEGEITEERYDLLLAEKMPGTRTIEKTRCTFPHGGHLIEIDLYPEWKNTCILETELANRDETVLLPDFISVVREVTGNRDYSNASMSETMPEEDIL